MASPGEVNAVYQKLEALRKTHGKIVRVAIGQRPVYGHRAQLTINDQDSPKPTDLPQRTAGTFVPD